jgi:DnaK suppressor protein
MTSVSGGGRRFGDQCGAFAAQRGEHAGLSRAEGPPGLRQINLRKRQRNDTRVMSHLDSLDPHMLRQRLAERAIAVRQELHDDRAKLSDNVNDVHVVLDRKDQADSMIQAGVDDAEFSRDLVELAQIEAALQRLDTGHFGLCADCAEPIAAQRLQAQPWVSRCLDCQSRFESAPRSAA